MTAVAANKKMMVADTLVDAGGMVTYNRKLFRCDNGDIVGLAGDYSRALLFYEWYNGDRKTKAPRGDYMALVLKTTGDLIFWSEGECTPVEDEFFAIGDGDKACLAVMHMGGSPKKAVQIAKKVCINVGGRSHIYRM